MYKCPTCGKFLKDVDYTVNGLGEVVKVQAICKTCGIVDCFDWDYDDFFPVETKDRT